MQLHESNRNAAVFAALGDVTRMALLNRLGRGERSLSALTEGTGMSRQAVTKHLDVLARAGLVRARRSGRERRYSATPAPLESASEWLLSYRREWEASLDRLDAYLQTLTKDPSP